MTLGQWFWGGVIFVPPGHLAKKKKGSLWTFLIVTTLGGGGLLLGARDSTKNPILHRTAPHSKELQGLKCQLYQG